MPAHSLRRSFDAIAKHMALADPLPAKAAKLSLVAVSVALFLFCALDNPTVYGQQGGNATGGAATGGPAVGVAPCYGCTNNYYGGPATGGQATGGAATGNGESKGTPSESSKPIDIYSFKKAWGSKGKADGQFHFLKA
jgi:hypothetical protein